MSVNKKINELEEMELADLEEQDYLLVWDDNEKKTKKVELQSIIMFIQMMMGK